MSGLHSSNCLFIIFVIVLLCFACKQSSKIQNGNSDPSEIFEKPRTPDWHKNAVIYEVNLRHFTPEGSFQAFESHIPRLAEMGIDILWFMPIHPISVKNRKGEMGSPYAVADYLDVNPDFGSLDDFSHMLDAIHAAGMYCIIDWVPNHTGWDNVWITDHPDWYTKGPDGEITDPINPFTGESWGWTDVADLDYSNSDMRKAMINAMTFWIEEVGIDGFRVDVAHGIPVDFWVECSDALYAIEPVFMLAEAEIPEILNNGTFVMDYGWEMHHLLNEIANSQGANKDAARQLVKGNLVDESHEQKNKKTALHIDSMLAKKDLQYSKGYQMHFTSNHDENAWSGTEFQRMGAGHKAFAVLTATFDGMPLIYTGMESALDKQLEFFTKDEVEWGNYSYADFYTILFELKEENQALWNGEHGGELQKIPTGNDENIYAFTREKNGDQVVVIINLSSSGQTARLQGDHFTGTYEEVFSGDSISLSNGQTMNMGAWEYVVLSN